MNHYMKSVFWWGHRPIGEFTMSDATDTSDRPDTDESCSCPKLDLRYDAEPQQPDEDCPTHGRCDVMSTANERCTKAVGHRSSRAMGDPCVFTAPADGEGAVSVKREQLIQDFSDAGAMCGDCGDEPGDRICPDCERVRGWYADAVLARLAAASREAAAAVEEENVRLSGELSRIEAGIQAAIDRTHEQNDEDPRVLGLLAALRVVQGDRFGMPNTDAAVAVGAADAENAHLRGVLRERYMAALVGISVQELRDAPASIRKSFQRALGDKVDAAVAVGAADLAAVRQRRSPAEVENAHLRGVLREVFGAVNTILAGERHDERALKLYKVLLRLATAQPHNCARSHGLHEEDCPSYVPGHELVSPVNGLRAYRAEMPVGRAVEVAAEQSDMTTVSVVWAMDLSGKHETKGFDWYVSDLVGVSEMYRQVVKLVNDHEAYITKVKEQHGVTEDLVDRPNWKLTLVTDDINGTGPGLERAFEVADLGRRYGVEVISWGEWGRRQQDAARTDRKPVKPVVWLIDVLKKHEEQAPRFDRHVTDWEGGEDAIREALSLLEDFEAGCPREGARPVHLVFAECSLTPLRWERNYIRTNGAEHGFQVSRWEDWALLNHA